MRYLVIVLFLALLVIIDFARFGGHYTWQLTAGAEYYLRKYVP
jgi:hypothetical protein